MSFIWEIQQQWQITEAKHEATTARFTAKQAQVETQRLRRQMDTVLLLCEALWTLLREQHNVGDDVLLERIKQIDLTDGHLDGCLRRPPTECPACHRPIPRRLMHCLYCGEPVEKDPFAR